MTTVATTPREVSFTFILYTSYAIRHPVRRKLARGPCAPRPAVQSRVVVRAAHTKLQSQAREVANHRAHNSPRQREEGYVQQRLTQNLSPVAVHPALDSRLAVIFRPS